MSAEMKEQMAVEFRPFWTAADAGQLKFPKCRSCDRFHWYPMKLCPYCPSRDSRDIAWVEVSGTGTLYTWTTVSHAFDPAYWDRIPYIVALVEFQDAPGVRLVTNVIDSAPDTLSFGMAVVPAFDARNAADDPLCFRAARP